MENLIPYLAFVTFFAFLVGNRASKLNRNPWIWGIIGWIVSPLGIWIVLEICGKRKVQATAASLNAAGDLEANQDNESPILEEEVIGTVQNF